MSDFASEMRHVKARKLHRCILCFGPIPPGEKYWYGTVNCNGRWFTNRYHDECADKLIEASPATGSELIEFTPGGFDWKVNE